MCRRRSKDSTAGRLRALTEDDADAAHVFDPVAPGYEAVNLADSLVRDQDPPEYFHRRRLARSVGADVAHQLPRLNREGDAVEGDNVAIASVYEFGNSAAQSGTTFGNAVRLAQVGDGDLWHPYESPYQIEHRQGES